MDALSDNSIPLNTRCSAAEAALEMMNATVAYYREMDDADAVHRYQVAKMNYDKALRDLTLFCPE